MDRYICIHGHFYQPPRENPWLEAIELQDSAYPYHDWNERITAECYAVNAVSRILDADHRIVQLVNNYSKMSFNFGPTLLSWLQAKAPEVHQAILEADRESQRNFSSHGSALAQAYNHIIMPLANTRDRRTQILWGIADFEHRFKRKPEGMWLPETAVDLESLDLLAAAGIEFTILAPHQAAQVRRIGGRARRDVKESQIDPTQAYEQRLPSGRKIALFFYDGPVSRAVAFEGLLSSGENLANRLASIFSNDRDWPELVHIATDGESYGHHHRFGDMGLAYALNYIETQELAKLTNYGEFLEKHPPTHHVEIIENTSWSCIHGIDRWRSNCGCNSGGHPEWNQDWRKPLREALDWLRDAIASSYEKLGSKLLKDPWAARDAYISVVLDRSAESVKSFFARHAARNLNREETTSAIRLLEMQRHAMLMYTSCGWFFDDLAGIEAVQCLQYAGRTVQLAQELFGDNLEQHFVDRLATAKSNVAENGDGRSVYEKFVRPARVDAARVSAHYAVSSLFENYPERTKIYCFEAAREDYDVFSAGAAKLAVGRVRLTSEITREADLLEFGVLHLGDHNVNAGVRLFRGDPTYGVLKQEVMEPFRRADFAEVIRVIHRTFGDSNYSLSSLFRDEQRRVLDLILGVSLREAENVYRQFYERRAPMMRYLTSLGIPLPKALLASAEFVLNSYLRAALEEEEIDPDSVRSLLETASLEGVVIDAPTLEYAFRQNLNRITTELGKRPSESSVQHLLRASGLIRFLPFTVDLWRVQNIVYGLLRDRLPKMREASARGDETANRWIAAFTTLAGQVHIKIV
jgi:alpha-amylase/alpha-mannosidase (GH57 family)